MEQIKKIFSEDDTLIALILPEDYHKDGSDFITDPACSFQLAYINNPAGYSVSRHCHPRYKRVIFETMECLFIKKGKVEVTFYDNNQKFIFSSSLKSGDLVLFIGGGHSLKNIAHSELLEIRQGPYNSSFDKLKF